jgi:hypothetical protein
MMYSLQKYRQDWLNLRNLSTDGHGHNWVLKRYDQWLEKLLFYFTFISPTARQALVFIEDVQIQNVIINDLMQKVMAFKSNQSSQADMSIWFAYFFKSSLYWF